MLVNRGIETFFPEKVEKDGGAHVYYQGERPLNGWVEIFKGWGSHDGRNHDFLSFFT